MTTHRALVAWLWSSDQANASPLAHLAKNEGTNHAAITAQLHEFPAGERRRTGLTEWVGLWSDRDDEAARAWTHGELSGQD